MLALDINSDEADYRGDRTWDWFHIFGISKVRDSVPAWLGTVAHEAYRVRFPGLQWTVSSRRL